MKNQFLLLAIIAMHLFAGAQTVDVTFQVDMKNETADTVSLNGSFVAWNPEEAQQLFANGSVYSATLQLTSGDTIQYKYVDGPANQWEQYEILSGLSCAYGNDGNRMLIVPEQDTILPIVCFAECSACTTDSENLILNPTFENGLDYWTNYVADTSVAVDFSASNEVMTATVYEQGINSYDIQLLQLNIPLEHGYIYAFSFDAQSTTSQSINISIGMDDSPWTSYYNTQAELNSEWQTFQDTFVMTNESNLYARVCADLGFASGSISFDNFSLKEIGLSQTVDVTFQVDMKNEDVSSDSVFIRGDWTNWEDPILLTSNGTIYSTTISLNIGETYQYKFLNGAEGWETVLDSSCTAPGNDNRIITAPDTTETILPLVCFGECSACISWYAPHITIREIQGEGDISPYDSIDVKTEGVITAINPDGVYIQDATDIRSGIWVYEPELINYYNRGTSVHFIGTAEEYFGRTSLNNIQFHQITDTVYYVNPQPINVWQVNEDYEGVLVKLNDVEVVGTDQYGQYLAVDQLNDTTIIDESFYIPTLDSGKHYNLTGVVHYRYNSFRICLRDEADIEPLSIDVTFQVDMQNETVSNDSVFLIGAWDDWVPLRLNADGTVYSATVTLTTGVEHQYKFTNGVDGWEENWGGSCTASNNDNRIFTVPAQDTILPLVCFGRCAECLQITNIANIQGPGDSTPLDEQQVRTAGQITGINQYGVFMQDSTGARSGIWVYDTTLVDYYSLHNTIELTATAVEYYETTELKDIVDNEFYNTPFNVSAANINASDIGEDYESVLVSISNLKVVRQDSPTQYTAVSEQSDTVLIHNFLYDGLSMNIGASYNIQGVLDYRYASFRILPRNEDDLQQIANEVNVTFQVNMQNETAADSVFVRGSWDAWGESVLLTQNGNEYSAEVEIEAGSDIRYKFINGNVYEDFWGDCTDTDINNRMLLVPEQDTILDIVCFNSCQQCVNAPWLTISEIQGDSTTTPYEGQVVRTKGRIIGINENGAFIQDTTGKRSGIFIYDTTLIDHFSQSAHIELTATAAEYNGLTELKDIVQINYSQQDYFPTYTSWIDASQIGEDYESVFVGLENMRVVDTTEWKQYITVSESNDTVMIDNTLFQPEMEIGAYYTITGIVSYRYESFRVNPRDANGITRLADKAMVTFQVDMQNETVANDSVFVTGSWDTWSQPQLLSENGGIYTTTLSMVCGDTIEYKFKNQETWEDFIGDCTTGDSNNRHFIVPTQDSILPVVCFNSCESCPLPAPTVNITFQVDMQNEDVPESGVFVTGGWDNWVDSTQLTASGNIYSTTLELKVDSSFVYRFYYEGTSELVEGPCADPAEKIRQLTCPDIDSILPLVCFGSCYACPSVYTIATDVVPAEGGIVSGAGDYTEGDTVTLDASPNDYYVFESWTINDSLVSTEAIYTFVASEDAVYQANFTKIPTTNVTFQVDMQNETLVSDTILLMGSWSNWSSPFVLTGAGTIYSGTLELPADSLIEYKFVNSANPIDYENYEIINGDCTLNGNNRFIIVPAKDTLLNLVCFGECDACPTMYTVATVANPEGGGITSGDGSYFEYDTVTVSAIPNNFFEFSNWTINDSLVTSAPTFTFIATEDVVLQANFTNIPTVNITFQVDMQNETVSNDSVFVKGSWDSWSSMTLLTASGTVYSETILMPADSSYEYKFLNGTNGWEENIDGDCTEPLIGNRVFATSNTDQTLPLVCFNSCEACPPTYTISASAEPLAGGSITGTGTYAEGDTVILYANSSNGYTFNNWTLNNSEVSSNTTYQFIATENVVLVAHFNIVKPTATVTFQVNMQNETVSSSGVFVRGSWDNWAQSVQLSANGNTYSGSLELFTDSVYEYKFLNGSQYEEISGTCTVEPSGNRELTVPANNQTLALVCFNSCENCLPNYTITTVANPENAGTVTGAGVYAEGETITLIAEASDGYSFNSWSVNSVKVSDNSTYEFAAEEDVTITANFDELPPSVFITFAVDMQNESIASEGVTVTGSWDNWAMPVQLTADGTIFSGTIEMTADSSYEYKFKNGETWEDFSGECTTGATNNRFFTAPPQDSALEVVCFNHCGICPAMYNVSLIANAPALGTVSGAGSYIEGEWITITATPADSCRFVSWTSNDSLVSTNESYQFMVSSDLELTANFEVIIPTVELTFRVDMQNELLSDSGVYINGSWSNWNSPIPMLPDYDQVFKITLEVQQNTIYEYKFVNGGGFEWENYEIPVGSQVNTSSGNREISVGTTNITVPLVCFNSSVACSSDEPPVAFAQTLNMMEDSIIEFSLQAIDTEDDFDDLVFNLVSPVVNSASFSMNENWITYQPNENFFGTDSFSFRVTDTQLNESEIAFVTINVTNVNDRPIAESFTVDANNNSTAAIDILSHISDQETPGTALDVSFIPTSSGILGGTINNSGTNTFSYTASNPETNEDYAVYKVSDKELSSFAEVVTISNLNDTKSRNIVATETSILTTNDEATVEYGQSIEIEFLGIDRSYPFEQLQIEISGQPKHGTLDNFRSSAYSGSILTTYRAKYTPTENAMTTDSVEFSVSNGSETVSGTFYIHVNAVKIAPILEALSPQTINENDTLLLNLSVNDADNEIDELNWDVSAVPNIALESEIRIENNSPIAQIVTPKNFSGNVAITLTVSDPDQLSDAEMFNLKVVNQNNAPEIRFENTLTAFEDSSFSYTLKAEDFDKDSLSFTLTGAPDWLASRTISKYAVEISGTPANANVGTSQITVEVTDKTDSISEVIWLEVINTNDLPYILEEFDTITGEAGGTPVSIDLSAYFADDDADATFTFSVESNLNPEIAQASIDANNLLVNFDSENLGTTTLGINAISQGDTLRTSIVVMVNNVVGTSWVNTAAELRVYPNPATSNFTVQFTNVSPKWELFIVDMSGQLIYKQEVSAQNEVKLNTNTFDAAGSYLIRAVSDGQIKTTKVIISK